MLNPISQTLTKLAARIPANQATVLGKAYANLAGPNSAGTFNKNFSRMMMDKNKANAANKAVAAQIAAQHKFDKPFAAIRGAGWD